MIQTRKLFIASGIFHPEAGGPATYLYEILPALQARGWEVRAMTYGSGETGSYPYPLRRVPRRGLPLRWLDYLRAASPLSRWADLIYLHTLGLPVRGAAPRVIKIVGDQAWERAIRRGWIPPTEDIDVFQTRRYGLVVTAQQAARAREVRGMTGVIVPSEYLRRMVVGWGVDAAKVRVIYNALPPETGDQNTPQTQQAARDILGLGDDAAVILTAARLTHWKGVDHLIMALTRVRDARLLIAGDGQLLPALQQLAREMKVAERVTFLGKVSRQKMPLYMKAADYTALYSGYEGLSHTLLESLRAGTPVIASDKGGNPEVVQHQVNGLLVPYVDVEALAAALTEALQPGKRAALAANHQIGMERFDFQRMVEHTSAALESFL